MLSFVNKLMTHCLQMASYPQSSNYRQFAGRVVNDIVE